MSNPRNVDEWLELQASLPPRFRDIQQPMTRASELKPKRKEREPPIHSFSELASRLRDAWTPRA